MSRRSTIYGRGDDVARALIRRTISGEINWGGHQETQVGPALCRLRQAPAGGESPIVLEVVNTESNLVFAFTGSAVEELAEMIVTTSSELTGSLQPWSATANATAS